MKKQAPVVIIIGLLGILLPVFITNAFGFGCATQPGNTCQLQVIDNIPVADRPGGVTIQLDGGSLYALNHTFTFANSTTHTIKVIDTSFIGAASGKRYAFKQWTYTGDGSQWDSSPTMTTPPMYTNYTAALCNGTLNCPFRADFTVSPALGCNSNCNLDALTNVPSSDGAIKVKVDGGTVYSLGTTFSFANGTVHTIQVLNGTFVGAASGARYVWKQWDCTCGISSTSSQTLTTPPMYYNYTVSQTGAFTARFDKQFPLTLSFKDQSGNSLAPPSSLLLTTGNPPSTITVNVTSYTGVYESAALWNVGSVVWEGITGVQASGQSIDLTSGAVIATITLEAYTAAIKVVDNSNNPLSGANVTISLFNSTRRTFQSNSQGLVQLGDLPCIPSGSSFVCTYTATVSYKGQTASTGSIDESNSQNNPYSVQLNVGTSPTSTPLVSAIVLLTIFGLATFLILLAIKVRKPPPPPQIDTGSP